SHLMSEYIRMTDPERDQIDQDAQIFMRTCADAIQQLRTEGVCKLYSEQRAIRVKRMVDKKRLYRLQTLAVDTAFKERTDLLFNSNQNLTDANSNFGLWGDGKGEDELSPEEIQMFEQENQRLVGEMNSLFDEVRICHCLYGTLAQQDTEIDNIHQLVVGATENIKEGNEDIREHVLDIGLT
ncbi:Syntaxin-18, partial [Chelonia mydas]